jgi:hypothetical protein
MTITGLRCIECGLTIGVFGSDDLAAAAAFLEHRKTHRRPPAAPVPVGAA